MATERNSDRHRNWLRSDETAVIAVRACLYHLIQAQYGCYVCAHDPYYHSQTMK